MNLEETAKLIQMLRQAGVARFKSHEHDIVFAGAPAVDADKDVGNVRTDTEVGPLPVAPAPLVSPENKEAVKKATDLINMLKMTPEQLVDQIFPAGANG